MISFATDGGTHINSIKSIQKILDMKREYSVKSVSELTEMGIITGIKTRARSDVFKTIGKLTYDDDGYCEYRDGDVTFDIYINRGIDESKKYTLINIHNIISDINISVDEKITAIDKITTKQPGMINCLFSNKVLGVRQTTIRVTRTIELLDKCGSKQLAFFVLGLLDNLTVGNIKTHKRYINEHIRGMIFGCYEIYTIMMLYNTEILYVSRESEMESISEPLPDDITFTDRQYKFLLKNENIDVIKHYLNKINLLTLTNIIADVKKISDAAYRLVCDILPRSYEIRGLKNISNIIHRMQRLNIISTGTVEYASLDSKVTLNFNLPADISKFLYGRDYEYGTSHEYSCKYMITLFNRTIINNIVNGVMTYTNDLSTNNAYSLHKLYKYCVKVEIDSNKVDRIIRYVDKSGDYWLLELIFDRHYCIQDSNLLNTVCKKRNVYDVIGRFIIPDLANIHECTNNDCPFAQRIIKRVKAANSRI